QEVKNSLVVLASVCVFSAIVHADPPQHTVYLPTSKAPTLLTCRAIFVPRDLWEDGSVNRSDIRTSFRFTFRPAETQSKRGSVIFDSTRIRSSALSTTLPRAPG